MNQAKAEAYLNAAANPALRVVIEDIQSDFDKAMRNVLKCPEEELSSRRGEARALEAVLKRFTDAKTVMEKVKNGAT